MTGPAEGLKCTPKCIYCHCTWTDGYTNEHKGSCRHPEFRQGFSPDTKIGKHCIVSPDWAQLYPPEVRQ